MKQLSIIGAGLAILVMVVTAVDARRAPRSAMKAGGIQVGDSREQVRARLGRPTELFRPRQNIPSGMYLGVHVEIWAYGGLFELRHCFWSEFPYFYPIKVRLFGPARDDLRVEFDSWSRVSRVLVPGT
jgi:hypothetical protein